MISFWNIALILTLLSAPGEQNYFKILFDAQLQTLNLSLSIGCRVLLFKAYLLALKRPRQAATANSQKETQIKK